MKSAAQRRWGSRGRARLPSEDGCGTSTVSLFLGSLGVGKKKDELLLIKGFVRMIIQHVENRYPLAVKILSGFPFPAAFILKTNGQVPLSLWVHFPHL